MSAPRNRLQTGAGTWLELRSAIQQVSRSAITPTYAAGDAVNGHALANSGSEFLHVKTVGTGTTVTVQIPSTVDGQAVTTGRTCSAPTRNG
jgi:hypothetical protein